MIKDYKNNVLKSGSIIVYGVHIKISIKIEDVCIDVMKTGIIGVYKRFSNTYPPLFNPARLQQCRRAGFFIEGGDLCAERADYRFTAGISA